MLTPDILPPEKAADVRHGWGIGCPLKHQNILEGFGNVNAGPVRGSGGPGEQFPDEQTYGRLGGRR